MRLTIDSGEIEVTWWIEVGSRELHLAVDRYEHGQLADQPDSFAVSGAAEVVAVLQTLGDPDAEATAATLWSKPPS
jgi:hypothetical protein